MTEQEALKEAIRLVDEYQELRKKWAAMRETGMHVSPRIMEPSDFQEPLRSKVRQVMLERGFWMVRDS